MVACDTQAEIDHFWEGLSRGWAESRCGWLKDRFGVSWQVFPKVLMELLRDPERAPRVTQAFLQMGKFDLEVLLKA